MKTKEFDKLAWAKNKVETRLATHRDCLKKINDFNSWIDGKAKTWFRATYGITADVIQWNTRSIDDEEVRYSGKDYKHYSFPLRYLWDDELIKQKQKELEAYRKFLEHKKDQEQYELYLELKEKYG